MTNVSKMELVFKVKSKDHLCQQFSLKFQFCFTKGKPSISDFLLISGVKHSTTLFQVPKSQLIYGMVSIYSHLSQLMVSIHYSPSIFLICLYLVIRCSLDLYIFFLSLLHSISTSTRIPCLMGIFLSSQMPHHDINECFYISQAIYL